MVLVKEQNLEGSQCHACYGGDLSIRGADHPFSSESFGHKGHNNMILEEGEGSDVVGTYSFNLLPLPLTTCPSNSSSSSNCTFAASASLPSEALSIVNLKALSDHRACSNFPPVLSFDHGDQMHHGSYLNYPVHDYEETAVWYDAMDQNCPINPLDMKRGTTGSQLIQANKGFEMESEYGFINNGPKDKQPEEDQFRLPYQSAIGVNGRQESIGQVTSHSRLRPCSSDDGEQSHKKLCCTIQKINAEPSSSKDLQSIAAKNRRKRINERLRILQDLVPSATKVDQITMLEKAISYVKLLQLQVKILATDEFWPTQGGKAPEVAQVKEAIDTILSSYRNSPKQQTVPCEEY